MLRLLAVTLLWSGTFAAAAFVLDIFVHGWMYPALVSGVKLGTGLATAIGGAKVKGRS